MAQARVQNVSEERLEVAGGLKIFIRSWRPDANARGVVVIVPGFNSHSGYYGWAAEQLVAERLLLSSPRSCIRAPSQRRRTEDWRWRQSSMVSMPLQDVPTRFAAPVIE